MPSWIGIESIVKFIVQQVGMLKGMKFVIIAFVLCFYGGKLGKFQFLNRGFICTGDWSSDA